MELICHMLKILNKKTYFLLFYFISFDLFSFDSDLLYSYHCLYSCPVSTTASGDVLVREIYTLRNNSNTKFADWVAYKINPSNFGKTKLRYFKKDPDLSSKVTLDVIDYKYANKEIGVDRGHLAPLASFSASEFWSYTNFLSNIAPQKSRFNQGIWKKLESQIRKVSKDTGTVLFLITGTIYDDIPQTLPHSNVPHDIPDEFYKVVYIPSEIGIEYIAFKIPQSFNKAKNHCGYIVDINKIQDDSGYKFFTTAQSIKNSDWLKTKMGC